MFVYQRVEVQTKSTKSSNSIKIPTEGHWLPAAFVVPASIFDFHH